MEAALTGQLPLSVHEAALSDVPPVPRMSTRLSERLSVTPSTSVASERETVLEDPPMHAPFSGTFHPSLYHSARPDPIEPETLNPFSRDDLSELAGAAFGSPEEVQESPSLIVKRDAVAREMEILQEKQEDHRRKEVELENQFEGVQTRESRLDDQERGLEGQAHDLNADRARLLSDQTALEQSQTHQRAAEQTILKKRQAILQRQQALNQEQATSTSISEAQRATQADIQTAKQTLAGQKQAFSVLQGQVEQQRNRSIVDGQNL